MDWGLDVAGVQLQRRVEVLQGPLGLPQQREAEAPQMVASAKARPDFATISSSR